MDDGPDGILLTTDPGGFAPANHLRLSTFARSAAARPPEPWRRRALAGNAPLRSGGAPVVSLEFEPVLGSVGFAKFSGDSARENFENPSNPKQGGRVVKRLCALGLIVALGVAAAPLQKIQFTDTQLQNGLRVIVRKTMPRPCSRSLSITTSGRVTSAKAAPGSRISSNT